MAEITNSVLGLVTGKISTLVFRKMNGKNFVSVRPKKYKPCKSDVVIQSRSNFAAVINFAKNINSVPGIKEIWTNAKVKGTNSFQKIIKHNLKLVNQGTLTTANKITPDGLFLKLNSSSINDSKLGLTLYFPGSINVKMPVHLFVVLYFKSYKNRILYQTVNPGAPSPDGIYDLNIMLSKEILRALDMDPEPVMYLAFSGSVPYRRKVYWSGTVSKQF